MPQLDGSVVTSTQPFIVAIVPAGQLQTPDTHERPLPQRTPQPPQLFVSVLGSTHAVPHVTPVLHWHTPAAHTPADPQFRSHVPQCSRSLVKSTQRLPHRVVPIGQTHCPDTHVASPAQRMPHAPQLAGSVETSAQPPFMQRIAPEPQVHTPIAHDPPGPQLIPQPPQFDASVAKLAQPFGHATCPVPHPQTPAAHVAQARPHDPQLVVSLRGSRHEPPHAINGAAHITRMASRPESVPFCDGLPQPKMDVVRTTAAMKVSVRTGVPLGSIRPSGRAGGRPGACWRHEPRFTESEIRARSRGRQRRSIARKPRCSVSNPRATRRRTASAAVAGKRRDRCGRRAGPQ